PLGPLERGAAVLLGMDGALDPGHRGLLSKRLVELLAEHPLDAGGVSGGNDDLVLEAPGHRGGLLLQDVVAEGATAAELAAAGGLEALGRAAVGLHLGHCVVPSWAPLGSGVWVRRRARRPRWSPRGLRQ